mgnify:CR=1 FL=1|tara:strand:+ start:2588 stop:3208 length:621 start_codon:yes stop_codon:yes gene_type:complete
MSWLTLPDELVRKVYGYILPIYDYVAYVKALEQYNDDNEALTGICEGRRDIITIDDRIEYNDVIATYACLMNSYLTVIRDFLKNNELFVRPDKFRGDVELTVDQYRWQGDWCIRESQARRMEKNIYIRRGMEDDIARGDGFIKTIVLHHDIVYMLKKGSIDTIIYNCRANNIPVIMEPYAELQRGAAGWANENEYRNYLVRELMKL